MFEETIGKMWHFIVHWSVCARDMSASDFLDRNLSLFFFSFFCCVCVYPVITNLLNEIPHLICDCWVIVVYAWRRSINFFFFLHDVVWEISFFHEMKGSELYGIDNECVRFAIQNNNDRYPIDGLWFQICFKTPMIQNGKIPTWYVITYRHA